MKYFRIAIVAVTINAALLVFPNRVPEFAGLWLSWCTWRMLHSSLTRIELFAIPVWLAIKWPEPTLPLAIFITAIVTASFRPTTPQSGIEKYKYILAFLWVSWFVWTVHHHLGALGSRSTSNPNGPVVCLGDSLTDYGYPDELRRIISHEVADFGFNGYTTVDGLNLVDEIVKLRPHTVVIELGGHDYKNGESRTETVQNIRDMILLFQESGARVVLVAIPRGFINDPWYGLERELARKHDLDLIPDSMIRKLIYFSPIVPPGSFMPEADRLSKDGLHPNEAGNRMMAETVAGYIE